MAFEATIYYDIFMTIDAQTDVQTKNPTLIMVRGVPGGGKSYIAAKLQESIGKERVVILDPDAIDKTGKEYLDFSQVLTNDDVNEKLHPYRFLRSKAYEGIEANKIIIWNQGFIDLDGFNKTVINLQTYALDHGTNLLTLVVEVEVEGNIAKQRVATRAAQGGHDVPEEAFDRFINGYESFSGKGYNTITVNGQDDATISLSTIIQALKELQQNN